ncbi:MAG: hypothetical protein R3E84_04095 [Pseudomonadales bacterium]
MLRRDSVAHFASVYIANATGVFHSWQKASDREQARIKLPHLPLLHFERANRRLNETLRQLSNSHEYMAVEHESFVQDADTTYGKLFQFLGLAPIPVTWQSAKKVLPDPREFITNYDQCLKWLENKDDRLASMMTGFYARYRAAQPARLTSFLKH